MELNLDRLNSLSFVDFQEKPPSTMPPERFLAQGEYKDTTERGNAVEGLPEGLGALQRKADQNKAQIDHSIEVYRKYQENTAKSGQLQTDILKGVRAGEDIHTLFLKAVKAISLMTSDTLFNDQIEADIKAIYGYGLGAKAPLQTELEEVRKRLQKLTEAAQREQEHDSQQRIQAAIQRHRNRTTELEELISRAS